MSEEDRMDRARRLRELRESRRSAPRDDEAGADGSDVTDDGDADAAGDDDGADEGDAEAAADVAAAVERVDAAAAEVPSAEDLEASLADVAVPEDEPDDGEQDAGAEAARDGAAADTKTGESTRILEFSLGDEQYCIDIDYVEEIVTDRSVSRVPNTPEYVAGVVDLRGQITTILDPKVLLDIEDGSPGELLVVFDGEAVDESGHIGWVVDDVRQVSPVTDAEVTAAPVEEAYVTGVVDREDDDSLVVWTSPELALEEAMDDGPTLEEPR